MAMDINKIRSMDLRNKKEIIIDTPPSKENPGAGMRKELTGWTCDCPVGIHNTPGAILKISKSPQGRITYQCSQGCTYGMILTALGEDVRGEIHKALDPVME